MSGVESALTSTLQFGGLVVTFNQVVPGQPLSMRVSKETK